MSLRSFTYHLREALYPTIQGDLLAEFQHRILWINFSRILFYIPIVALVSTGSLLLIWLSRGVFDILAILNGSLLALALLLFLVAYHYKSHSSHHVARTLLFCFVAGIVLYALILCLLSQGYSNQIVLYAIVLIGLEAGFVFMPAVNTIIVVCSWFIMLVGILVTQHAPSLVRSHCLNITSSSIVALIIGQMIVRIAYHDFIQRKTIQLQAELIATQNQRLESANTDLLAIIAERDEQMLTLEHTMHALEQQKVKTEHYLRQNIDFQELKERFVKSSVHDLKNPLTGLMLIADTLMMGKRKPTLTDADLGKKINDVSRRILLVVNSLLAELNLFSATIDTALTDTDSSPYLRQIRDDIALPHDPDSPKLIASESMLHDNHTKQDIFAIVEHVIEEMLPRIESKEQEVNTISSGSGRVRAPYNSLVRIVENILSNAIKYTPYKGSIFVSLTEFSSTITLQVQDSGQGFTSEEIATLFSSSGRRSSTPTGGESSHGLGLQSTLILLTEIQGSISVESAGKGHGSTFTIVFPKVVD